MPPVLQVLLESQRISIVINKGAPHQTGKEKKNLTLAKKNSIGILDHLKNSISKSSSQTTPMSLMSIKLLHSRIQIYRTCSLEQKCADGHV
jgi:hypothetical protein